jgi:aminoglycoside phosphotransferase (APT) family kinase protein
LKTTRNGLSAAALARVCDAIAPGGRVLRARPLRGGLSASVHLVLVEAANGARGSVVVRRYGEYWQRVDAGAWEREFRLLTALAESSFPAPRPLLLDAAGGPFGAPTVVMSRLPGRPQLAPRNLDDYLGQIARMLAALHALPTAGLEFLPDQRAMIDRNLGLGPEAADAPELPQGTTYELELQRAVRVEVLAEWARVSQTEPHRVLVHGDFWPGNLLWLRRRLVGVVDWEQPRLGDPAKDVATCRGDLSVLFGPAAADAFTRHYEQASGRTLTNMRFWDLFVSTWAVPEIPDWWGSYRILGRTDLPLEVARARIDNFARAALARG